MSESKRKPADRPRWTTYCQWCVESSATVAATWAAAAGKRYRVWWLCYGCRGNRAPYLPGERFQYVPTPMAAAGATAPASAGGAP